VIVVDTNLLVYAHRSDAAQHAKARDVVRALAEGLDPWGIPWPCLHEFVAVVTNPRVFREPTPPPAAVEQVDRWLESPSVGTLGESPRHWATLSQLLHTSEVRGARVHDARIVAICLDHGARELLSADRNFSRFPSLRVRNPLVGG
jgi:toxin-antitoxin system PIN domain toxin